MAERIDLTTPFQQDPRVASDLSVQSLLLDWSAERVIITLGKAGVGVEKKVIYAGSIAIAFMTALNKANLSTKSLHKRILERLVADGHLVGTLSGSPD